MQEYTPFFQGEKRNVTEKLAKYFEHSGLETKIHFDDEKLIYILSVLADKEKEARKLYQAFYFTEREHIDNLEDNEVDELDEVYEDNEDIDTLEEIGESLKEDSEDKVTDDDTTDMVEDDLTESVSDEVAAGIDDPNDDTPNLPSLLSSSGSYVMKSEKYNDYIGTFYIFLFLGVAGIIFVILNITEVLSLLNGLFPNLIMGALFLFFIYVGISTGIKAKNLQYEIEEEKHLTDKINQWLSNNVTDKFLKSISNEDISDELDYIKKSETIRDMLIKEFGDINTDYLDRLIEDFYSNNFDPTEDQV